MLVLHTCRAAPLQGPEGEAAVSRRAVRVLLREIEKEWLVLLWKTRRHWTGSEHRRMRRLNRYLERPRG